MLSSIFNLIGRQGRDYDASSLKRLCLVLPSNFGAAVGAWRD